MLVQIGNILSGIVIGVLGTVVYDKIKKWYEAIKVGQKKRKVHPIDLFEEYVCLDEIKQAISYGDPKALLLAPLMQSGKAILSANVDVSKCPKSRENRHFIMALLKYVPSKDWSFFSELGYSLSFKIRGTIVGIQLEVKDSKGQKIIDTYVKVTDTFEKHFINLRGKKERLLDVNEVCFTVFCESKYIVEKKGKFEIFEFMLSEEQL